MLSQIFAFNGGEISPRLSPRSDLQRYFSSVATLTNFVVLPFGGIARRAGFEHIDTFGTSSIRLFPFRYSAGTAFVLALSNNIMRFYSNGQTVKVSGSPLEVATPWPSSALADLRMEQVLDTVYFVHPNYAPRKLVRVSDTSWTLELFSLTAQPFMDENATSVTVTPSGTTGSITLTASAATFLESHVGAFWRVGHLRATNTQGVNITATGNGAGVLTQGDFVFKTTGTFSATVALQQSTDNSTWEVLGSWSIAGDRNIEYQGTVYEPTFLRASVTAYTSSTGTPRATVDAVDPLVWGSVEITGFTSSTVVTATVRETLLATDATAYWAEGSWSARNGYPRQVVLHDGRMVFAGTTREPLTLWLSAVNEYGNFRRNANDPSASRQLTLYSATADKMQWLTTRGANLIVGTAGDEWIISNAGDPDNAVARRATTYGSAGIGVAELNDSLIFVERRGERMRDYIGLDVNRDDLARDPYSAGDLTLVAEHITRGGITQLAVSQAPDPIIWGTVGGNLIGLNYDRAQSVMGWHRHTTDGAIGSVTTIPGATSDEVWIAALRNGTQRIERMHPTTPTAALDGLAADCMFFDSGLLITQASSATVSGLSHLEGRTVSILADGGTVPPRVVVGGQITLDAPATKIAVGLPFTSLVKTLPLVAQLQSGSTRYKIGRVHEMVIDLYNSFGLEYSDGERVKWYQLQQQNEPTNSSLPPALTTGPVAVPIAGGYSRNPSLQIRQSTGLPATILSLMVSWDSTEQRG